MTRREDVRELRGEQAAQQMEQDRQINNLTAQYRYAVQSAIAENDYGRAAALVDEANNKVSQLKDAYNLQITDLGNAAALLAEAGDYSGYKDLYGYTDDQVAALTNNWAMSNPDSAYSAGIIDGYTYYQLTGNWPVGFDPWSGGSSDSSSSGSIKGTYYDNKVLGRGVIDSTKNLSKDPNALTTAVTNYINTYGSPSKDTINSWARNGIVYKADSGSK